MAEEIPERTADLANIPDPALNHKHRIKVDVAFITQEQALETGLRRLWLKFRRVKRSSYYGTQSNDQSKELYDTKAGLYISQPGKWGIIWFDDKYWKVTRKKKLSKRASYNQPVMLKVDVAPIEIEESRAKSLDILVAKMEFEVEDEAE